MYIGNDILIYIDKLIFYYNLIIKWHNIIYLLNKSHSL